MVTTNITNARKELYKIASSCIKYNEVVNINTKEGNIIVMSEEEYRSLIESLFFFFFPGMYESLEEISKTPTSEMIKEAPWK